MLQGRQKATIATRDSLHVSALLRHRSVSVTAVLSLLPLLTCLRVSDSVLYVSSLRFAFHKLACSIGTISRTSLPLFGGVVAISAMHNRMLCIINHGTYVAVL